MADKKETAAAEAPERKKTFADELPAGVISQLTKATKLSDDDVKEAINGLKLHPAATPNEVAVAGELVNIYGSDVKYGDGQFFHSGFELEPRKDAPAAPAETKGGDKK